MAFEMELMRWELLGSKFQIPTHEIHPLTSIWRGSHVQKCSTWLGFSSPSSSPFLHQPQAGLFPPRAGRPLKHPNSLLPSIKKVQGIYVMTSSGDNSSHMEAMKATFEEGRRDDSLRFFGVHQLGLSESHVAVVGGTGRYHDADGVAIVEGHW